MRKILTLGVICVLAVFLFDCKVTTTASKKGPESEKENDKKDERVPVEVAFIGRGAIEAVIRASTNLEADARVEVFSRSTNLVAELLVEEGDAIAENQLLLRLENQTQKIQLNKAEVRLDKAVMDRIDKLVPPGTNINPMNPTARPFGLLKTQRRRPGNA